VKRNIRFQILEFQILDIGIEIYEWRYKWPKK